MQYVPAVVRHIQSIIMQSTLPVQPSERSDILDVLRGFALLGIILANSSNFTGYLYLNDAYQKQLFTHANDGWISFVEHAFIEGKFYSLFSLLFGIGFSIILSRNERPGKSPLRIFYRRLFILLLFGALHLALLWEGDILFLYAMIGFLLPLFRKCSDRTLLVWAVCLILSPILIDIIKVLTHWTPSEPFVKMAMKIDTKNGIPQTDDFAFFLFKRGSGYEEILKWCQGGFFWRYQYIIESNRIPKVLGMFLIGFYVGRKLMYVNLTDYTSLLKKIQRWGFLIGIPTGLAYAYFLSDRKSIPFNKLGLLDTFFYAASVVPLSLAYTSSICLTWVKTGGQSWLRKLAPVGRMALTNYLMQTILSILIYYNIGLGLGTKFGPTLSFPIAIGIYLLQVIYSNIWFRYFQFGPLEWIWRQLTYGKRLPLRKQ